MSGIPGYVGNINTDGYRDRQWDRFDNWKGLAISLHSGSVIFSNI